MTATLGWVIDHDYINSGNDSRNGLGQKLAARDGDNSVIIRKVISVERRLKASDVVDPIRFRLLDDDGEVYYGGAIDRSWLDGDEQYSFAPLDYGTADAGCTEMQYRDESGEWATL